MVALNQLIFSCLILTLASAEQCFVPGRCEHSDLIHATITDNPTDCLHACQTNPGCQWFSNDKTDGFCMEFSNCIELTTEQCQNCISGQKTCLDPLQCSVVGECHGTYNFAYGNINSEANCLEICKSENTCQWYTYFTEFQYCLTFDDCSLDESEPNAISGQKNCPGKIFTSQINLCN